MPIRVMLVDDHALVRMGMQQLIQGAPDLELVGDFEDGWAALDCLKRQEHQVDVMVCDLSMPRLSGLELLLRALGLRPQLAVLIVSVHSEAEYASMALGHGARGYLSKSCAHLELVDAIRALARGRTYVAAQAHHPAAEAHHRLSPRELQIFLLLVEGRSVSEVAAELNVGVSTVSTHVGRMREKLGVETVAEMVHYAYRHGLIA